MYQESSGTASSFAAKFSHTQSAKKEPLKLAECELSLFMSRLEVSNIDRQEEQALSMALIHALPGFLNGSINFAVARTREEIRRKVENGQSAKAEKTLVGLFNLLSIEKGKNFAIAEKYWLYLRAITQYSSHSIERNLRLLSVIEKLAEQLSQLKVPTYSDNELQLLEEITGSTITPANLTWPQFSLTILNKQVVVRLVAMAKELVSCCLPDSRNLSGKIICEIE